MWPFDVTRGTTYSDTMKALSMRGEAILGNYKPCPRVPLRYQKIRLTACKCDSL